VPELPAHITFGAARGILGVSERTFFRYIDAGFIQAYELPTGALRFKRSDVEALLKPKKASTTV
jgi:predicted site-specific integrase-resolvase